VRNWTIISAYTKWIQDGWRGEPGLGVKERDLNGSQGLRSYQNLITLVLAKNQV
jgi:hypothetical protein